MHFLVVFFSFGCNRCHEWGELAVLPVFDGYGIVACLGYSSNGLLGRLCPKISLKCFPCDKRCCSRGYQWKCHCMNSIAIKVAAVHEDTHGDCNRYKVYQAVLIDCHFHVDL